MRTQLALLTTLLSTSVMAHPGHDHGHFLSDPIHFLTALAIAGVVVAGVFVARNKLAKHKAQDK